MEHILVTQAQRFGELRQHFDRHGQKSLKRLEGQTMIEQGTPEWFAQRLGKVTASRVADVIAKTKTGYSTSRDNYWNLVNLEHWPVLCLDD